MGANLSHEGSEFLGCAGMIDAGHPNTRKQPSVKRLNAILTEGLSQADQNNCASLCQHA